MKSENIYLIGMMGSGKSTTGQLLSKKLKIECIDMDNELERLMDMSIQMILSEYGEKRFRMIESTFFREITKAGQLIYATGGGIILDKSNRKIIKDKGISIFLDCSIDTLIKRIKKDKKIRPLIKDEFIQNIKDIYNDRYSLYKECAQHTIDTSSLNEDQVIKEIAKCIH